MPQSPNYSMPAFGTDAPTLLGFLNQAVSEGRAWLDAQRPAVNWESVFNMLSPSDPSSQLDGQSNVGYNKTERQAREVVAALSNFKHEGEFKPTFDQALYDRAHQLTKLDRHWAAETHAYNRHREALQYAVTIGTGYLVEEWNKDFWGNYGDIELKAFAPGDVMFVQLPKSHDIQQAYMVIIREEMPINLARAVYPTHAALLEPDRDSPGWLERGLRKVQALMGGSQVFRLNGANSQQTSGSFPTVDIYRAYIMDNSINETGESITMGPPGANWSYTVPSYGADIPTGKAGETRKADRVDAKMFPLRRYAIWSRTTTIYDGTSPWWHGQVPIARYRFNDWAWEALGKSMIGDSLSMQDSIVAMMRGVEDSIAARLDPPRLYDENLVSRGFAENFNPRKAGSVAAANLNAGEIIKFPIQADQYNLPPFIPDWIKAQEGRMDYQVGTPDLVAIAKAKQVPGQGTLEKLMEMAGPLVQDMVRSLEEPLHQLGQWRKAYYFQFYNRARMITIVGPDGNMTDEQFTPDKIVPAVDGESITARMDRARLYMGEFKYVLTESGINEIHRMTNKLAYLQLQKAGLPLDWWTLAKIWQVPNFGPEPEGTHTVMDRFIAQKHIERELAEELAEGQAKIGAQYGDKGKTSGRPNSNQKPPHIVQKDGGTRSTVSTS